MKKKTLIHFTPHIPFPLNSGGARAQYYFIDKLREVFDITLCFPIHKYNTYSSLKSLQKIWPNVNIIPFDWRKNKTTRLLLQKIAYKLYKKTICDDYKKEILEWEFDNELFNNGFLEFVSDLLRIKKYDIIEVDFVSFLPLIYLFPEEAKKIFVQHEIGYIQTQTRLSLDHSRNTMKRFLLNKKKREEINLMSQYDKVITLTEVDKRKLTNDGLKCPIEVSPAAVSDVTKPSKLNVFEEKLIFVGGSTHFPNLEGLTWFINKVWPIVQQHIPLANLEIIGTWDITYKKSLTKDKSIRFLGFVEDLYSQMKGGIMIVPIRIGSGMRMKILDAANFCCPIVTTQLGIEGLEFSDTDCIITENNDNEQMAKKIIDLWENIPKQNELALNSKKIYDQLYSIETLTKQREKALTNFT